MTVLLMFWLLGAEPNEPATRTVGPILTEEKCALPMASSLKMEPSDRYCVEGDGISYCSKEGRKVCMEVVEDCNHTTCDSTGICTSTALICTHKVSSRHCWCAETDSVGEEGK